MRHGICSLAHRSGWVLCLLLLLAAPARSSAAVTEFSERRLAKVHYTPGSSSVDGYEFATIDVAYKFAACGRLSLLYLVVPESLFVQRFYWYQGQRFDLPSTVAPDGQSSVRFEGRVMGRVTDSFSVLAERGVDCATSRVKLGMESDLWEAGATASEKQFALNGLAVGTASAGFNAPALVSARAERYCREAAAEARERAQQATKQQASAEKAGSGQARSWQGADDAPGRGTRSGASGGTSSSGTTSAPREKTASETPLLSNRPSDAAPFILLNPSRKRSAVLPGRTLRALEPRAKSRPTPGRSKRTCGAPGISVPVANHPRVVGPAP